MTLDLNAMAALEKRVRDAEAEAEAWKVEVDRVRRDRDRFVKTLAATEKVLERVTCECDDLGPNSPAFIPTLYANFAVADWRERAESAELLIDAVRALCEPVEESQAHWRGDPKDNWYFAGHDAREAQKAKVRATLDGDL